MAKKPSISELIKENEQLKRSIADQADATGKWFKIATVSRAAFQDVLPLNKLAALDELESLIQLAEADEDLISLVSQLLDSKNSGYLEHKVSRQSEAATLKAIQVANEPETTIYFADKLESI